MTTGRINQVAFLEFPRGRPRPQKAGPPPSFVRGDRADHRREARRAYRCPTAPPAAAPARRPSIFSSTRRVDDRRRVLPARSASKTPSLRPAPRSRTPRVDRRRLDGPRDELSGPPRAAEAARPRIASSVANPFRLVRYATQQTQAHEPKAENGA